MANLSSKTVIVTGASKGIGAAIAEKLAADGAAVIVNFSTSAREAETVVANIQKRGGRAVAVRADVSKRADTKKLFETAVREYGRVRALVNNAALFRLAPLDKVDEQLFDQHFNLNVKGLFFAIQEAVNSFADAGGSIINISSVAALAPRPNLVVYCATKAAVDAITQGLAAELGPKKILVNSSCPARLTPRASKRCRVPTIFARLSQPRHLSGGLANRETSQTWFHFSLAMRLRGLPAS